MSDWSFIFALQQHAVLIVTLLVLGGLLKFLVPSLHWYWNAPAIGIVLVFLAMTSHFSQTFTVQEDWQQEGAMTISALSDADIRSGFVEDYRKGMEKIRLGEGTPPQDLRVISKIAPWKDSYLLSSIATNKERVTFKEFIVLGDVAHRTAKCFVKDLDAPTFDSEKCAVFVTDSLGLNPAVLQMVDSNG